MWTDTTRAQYARVGLSLAGDLADVERALLEPLFPVPCRLKRTRKWPLRRIAEAILYLLRGLGRGSGSGMPEDLTCSPDCCHSE